VEGSKQAPFLFFCLSVAMILRCLLLPRAWELLAEKKKED